MQNLIFKGLNGEFKIAATTQYITRIKDSTNKRHHFNSKCENWDKVLLCSHLRLTSNGSREKADLHALNNISSSIDKVS